jgi:CTP synthase
VGRVRSARTGGRRAAARRFGRHPGSRRFRVARHARDDESSEHARTHGIPFFGICYGFQWATVEYARNVCGLDGADSTEVDEAAPHKVIYKLRDLLGVDDLGGTMRLGRYACELASGSLARKIYGTDLIYERHRHRFEFNCLYESALAEKA